MTNDNSEDIKYLTVTQSAAFSMHDGTPALKLETEEYGTLYIPMNEINVNALRVSIAEIEPLLSPPTSLQ